MSEPISGALGKLTTQCGQAILAMRAEIQVLLQRLRARWRHWLRSESSEIAGGGAPQMSRALVAFTTKSSEVILALPGRGRALVQRVPEPVQTELKKLSARSAHVCREIFAGILVVG